MMHNTAPLWVIPTELKYPWAEMQAQVFKFYKTEAQMLKCETTQ